MGFDELIRKENTITNKAYLEKNICFCVGVCVNLCQITKTTFKILFCLPHFSPSLQRIGLRTSTILLALIIKKKKKSLNSNPDFRQTQRWDYQTNLMFPSVQLYKPLNPQHMPCSNTFPFSFLVC